MLTPQVFAVRRPLILSGAASHTVIANSQVSTVESLIGDQTNYDGLYYNLSLQPTHFRQSVPTPPAMIVLGDQLYVDGFGVSPTLGASYHRPVTNPNVNLAIGENPNQDAVFGIICDAQPYHHPTNVPPMLVLGNQDNSESVVVFPRSPESYFQPSIRPPLVSVGHQEYADGIVDVPRVQQAKRQAVPLRCVVVSVGDDRHLDGFGSIIAVPINPPPPPPPTNYLPIVSVIVGDQTYHDGLAMRVTFGATFHIIKPVGLPTRVWRLLTRQTTR